MHYQVRNPQAKLVRAAAGEVFDVALDIRLGSPNFGEWYGAVLSSENQLQMYIPKGFAHGFVVRSESADFLYKCSEYYDGPSDRGILWNDPAIGIEWNIESPILSGKDRKHLPLSQVPHEFLPRYEP
jgi:dTDP-4-dehydrorhamnose 3,5-epimerase